MDFLVEVRFEIEDLFKVRVLECVKARRLEVT